MCPRLIRARPLVISLLVALYLPTALSSIAQQPSTVNVRPRLATAQPGVPQVRVTVNRNRVPLGEEVTFHLSPASVVMDSRYRVTLYFGDGAIQLMRQTQIVHLYRKPGNYTYSILVESPRLAPMPTPTPFRAPAVKLSAEPTAVERDRLVNFMAQLSHPYPNIKYRFVFADGSQTGWQDNPRTTHSYRSPNTYQAYVDIGTLNYGSTNWVGSSPRQRIKVTQTRPPPPIVVRLTANSMLVDVTSPVSFTARVGSREPNVRYRFDFGDRSAPTDWQVSPRTKHKYSSAGNYPARVDVRVISSRIGPQSARSTPLPIKVKDTGSDKKPAVALTVIPNSILEGLPVFFNAISSSADSKLRYRFNFGDGSPPSAWTENPKQIHLYAMAGNYPAFAEIALSSNEPISAVAVSDSTPVRVMSIIAPHLVNDPTPPRDMPTELPATPTPLNPPTPTSTDTPTILPGPIGATTPAGSPNGWRLVPGTPNAPSGWWKYAIIAAIILFVIAAIILFSLYRRSEYFSHHRSTFVTHLDPGKSNVETGGPAELVFWNSVNNSNNAEDFNAYLKKYPHGEFTDLAKIRIRSLSSEGALPSHTAEIPATPSIDPSPASGGPAELTFWNSVNNSNNAEDFNAYLKKYPHGEFTDLAKIRINSLSSEGALPSPAADTPATPSIDRVAYELSYWETIKNSTRPDNFWSYLERYPDGPFAALARSNINSLGTASPASGGPAELAFWNSVNNSNNAEDFNAYLKKYPHGEFTDLAKIRISSLGSRTNVSSVAVDEIVESHTRALSKEASENINTLVLNIFGGTERTKTPLPDVAGIWNYPGGEIRILSNGTCTLHFSRCAVNDGTWAFTDNEHLIIKFTWKRGFSFLMTLSADEQRMQGTTELGPTVLTRT